MKRRHIVGALTGLFLSAMLVQTPSASAASWVTDWSLVGNNILKGTVAVGADTVDVGLTGPFFNLYSTNFNNPSTLINDYYDTVSATGANNISSGNNQGAPTYGNLDPSGLIQVQTPGQVTITFSKPVTNPYMSLVSLGAQNIPVTYDFSNLQQNAINVVSYGNNDWEYYGYSLVGNAFTGTEFNGILQLMGTYSSITFNIDDPEYWHGFNIGTSPVPEPASMLLFGFGLTGFGMTLVRRKK